MSEPNYRKPLALLDIPFDILTLIFCYLEAKDFLATCATCRALNTDSVRFDNSYWSQAARRTFRVRNRPQIPNWYRLFYRLRVQSKVYTWGQDTCGCLGHKRESKPVRLLGPGDRRRGMVAPRMPRTNGSDVPKVMDKSDQLGVVADLQCGGWSTSILNDQGIIYTAGILNGEHRIRTGERDTGVLSPLRFPPGFPVAGERYEPATAIRSFSSGRSQILGLADSGRIWLWYNAERPSLHVIFHGLDYTEGDKFAPHGERIVRDIVAGWTKCTAYITGIGIVIWHYVGCIAAHQPADKEFSDTLKVFDWEIVPRSGYLRPRGRQREPDRTTAELGEAVGEVKNWIVLEDYIVFVTDTGKAFASRNSSRGGVILDVFELTELHAAAHDDHRPAATDVQGSFRSFSVFKANGEVLIADQGYLDAAYEKAFKFGPWDTPAQLPSPLKIPALQRTSVVQVAFGDWHYLALHSDGHVTSYGKDPGSSGSLGFGPTGRSYSNTSEEVIFPSSLRGLALDSDPWQSTDNNVLPHCYFTGRKVWFQAEMHEWTSHLLSRKTRLPSEENERIELCKDLNWRGELSELIEQYSMEVRQPLDAASVSLSPPLFQPPFRYKATVPKDDGLGAHFVLSLAAAGWHTGALVLVNTELERAVAESCLVREKDESNEEIERFVWHDDSFPRIRLSTGEEMPGTIEFSPWKKEPPKEFAKLRFTRDLEDSVFGVKGWRMVDDERNDPGRIG